MTINQLAEYYLSFFAAQNTLEDWAPKHLLRMAVQIYSDDFIFNRVGMLHKILLRISDPEAIENYFTGLTIHEKNMHNYVSDQLKTECDSVNKPAVRP